MELDGIDPDLPDCDALYLVEYLFEIGPVHSGPSPITYQDIESFQNITGIDLDNWEIQTLRRLSVEYAGQLNESRDPYCAAPYAPDNPKTTSQRNQAVANQLSQYFGSQINSAKTNQTDQQKGKS